MFRTRLRTVSSILPAVGLLLMSALVAFSQPGGSTTHSTGNSRTIASGEKVKIKGVVVSRSADVFTMRDANGVDTVVRLTDHTSVKANGGFLRSGTNYGQTNIM